MKTRDRFFVTEFKNPRSIAYRVYGRKSDGTVIRENFKDYPHALARKQELEIETLNSPLVLVMQPTRLSTLQLRDAEAAYQRLAPRPGSTFTLVDCVELFLRSGTSDLHEITVEAAAKRFLEDKTTQNLRERSLETLRRRVAKLVCSHGRERVSEVNVEAIKKLIHRAGKQPLTVNSDRSALHGFFEWCVQQDYRAANPVAKISPALVETKEPTVLSLDKIKQLLRAARDFKGGVLAPYFVLSLFCGLRPKEVNRLNWAAFDLENKVATVRGAEAKLRARRIIELTDNAVDWLKPHCPKTPIAGPNWRRDFDSVRRACGFKGSVYRKKCDAQLEAWPVDVLRHTAISYWQARFKDEGACADRHGNSVETVHRYYRGLVRPKDAEMFWRMTPENMDESYNLPMPQPAVAA